jgi:hypothetical protein
MCQVHSDAALIYKDRLVNPLSFEIEKISWIVPHPLEPDGPFVEQLVNLFPKAYVTNEPAYSLMPKVEKVVTISSSTGYEAPLFGCKVKFLMKPRIFSSPKDLYAILRAVCEQQSSTA